MRALSRATSITQVHSWRNRTAHMRWKRTCSSCILLAAKRAPATTSALSPSPSSTRTGHAGIRLFASPSSSTQQSDDEIERETIEWVKRIVVGWSLCPFADRTIREKSLKLETVRGRDEETILGAALGEMVVRKDFPGTTLVIAPECFPDDFAKYLEYVNAIEQLMPEYELDGHVQVAPFHPLFEFEGSGTDGIDNYTNRAPYPIFHVLREQEVESAVDKLGGDASKVWKRNVELLQDMQETLGGEEQVKNAMKGSPSLKDKVDQVLKRHRFKVGDKE